MWLGNIYQVRGFEWQDSVSGFHGADGNEADTKGSGEMVIGPRTILQEGRVD
jgi:hypothetical protein